MAEPYVIGGSHRGGEPFDFKGHVCEIDSDIDVELLGALAEIEESVQADEDERKARNLLPFRQAVIDGKRILLGLMRESNPEIPDDVGMGVGDIMEITAFILRGKSAAQTIREGFVEAMLEDVGEEPEELEAAAAVTKDGEASEVPLPERSQKRSSPSARRTSGRRTTGKTSQSESSSSSSAKRAAA